MTKSQKERIRRAASRCWLAAILWLVLTLEGFTAEPLFSISYPAWIGALAYSHDGKLLAVGTANGTVRLLRASDGHEIAAIPAHTDAITCVALTPDSRRIITGSFDHTARIWDISSAKLRKTFSGHCGAVMSLGISPDGKTLATCSIDGSTKLWNPLNGERRATLFGHKSWVNSVVFSPGGRNIFSGSSDGTVSVWELAHELKVDLVHVRWQEWEVFGPKTLQASLAEVRSMAISTDGKILAAGLRYGTVKTWVAPDWKESHSFKAHDADVWTVSSLPKSSVLVTGDGDWNRAGQIKFWDARSGALLLQLPTSGEVLALAVSPVSQSIAVGCWNGKLEVFEVPRVAAGRKNVPR